MAGAFRAFRDADPKRVDLDWAGALRLAELADDISFIRTWLERLRFK